MLGIIFKQHRELPEHLRLEMQALGIKPVSKSRDGYISAVVSYATGKLNYAIDQPGSKYDERVRIPYPERREDCTTLLAPAFERHVQLHQAMVPPAAGAAAAGPAALDAEVEEIAGKLRAMRIGPA